MKGKMKNVALVFFMVLLAASAFAGGGSQGQGSGASVPVSASAASTAPVTIEFWYGGTVSEAGPPPEDWKVLRVVKDKLNINWIPSMLPSGNTDRDTKINAAAASNALPDVFFARREVWINVVKTGLIAPVDDLYPLMPAWTKIYVPADAKAYTTVNGKSMAIPYLGGSQPTNEGIVIRKDWLDNLGLKVPATLDDYFNVMKAFTLNDPDKNGKNDTYGYGAFIEINTYEEGLGRRFDSFFGAYGVAGTWDLRKSSPGLNIHRPGYYDALVYIKKMVDEKVIDPNWASYGKDDFRANWKQGKFGIMREQHSAYASESNYAPFDKNFPNGDWIVIDPPKGPQGLSSVGTYTNSFGLLPVSSNAIKNGKGPAVAKLFEWMASEEGYYLLGWGELGVNYLLDKDKVPIVEGLPDPAKGYIKPEMQPLTQMRGIIQRNNDAELVSRYPTYKAPTSGKTMSALVTLREMQAKPWTVWNGADALPVPNADVKRFYEQGVIEFVLGQRQLTKANWDAWVAEFDKMGGAAWEKAGIETATSSNYLR
ncbi:MAG: ABC transporter substrate-binding protein [Treponema sp.]|jgi:putative aldouronate transport system substrate-binding protein|nr:ABC transporter substrate-binding protein [Treponema sp.]